MVPPVIFTALAFCVLNVPRPVIAVFGMLLKVLFDPDRVLFVNVCVAVNVTAQMTDITKQIRDDVTGEFWSTAGRVDVHNLRVGNDG